MHKLLKLAPFSTVSPPSFKLQNNTLISTFEILKSLLLPYFYIYVWERKKSSTT